jgi:hypothetical protein
MKECNSIKLLIIIIAFVKSLFKNHTLIRIVREADSLILRVDEI